MFHTMKPRTRLCPFLLCLAGLLAACGGQAEQPSSAVAGKPAIASIVASTMPQPDCAADACTRLRVIDGNAEAARYDAQQRAERDAQAGIGS